jgi:hypothetical protein
VRAKRGGGLWACPHKHEKKEGGDRGGKEGDVPWPKPKKVRKRGIRVPRFSCEDCVDAGVCVVNGGAVLGGEFC